MLTPAWTCGISGATDDLRTIDGPDSGHTHKDAGHSAEAGDADSHQRGADKKRASSRKSVTVLMLLPPAVSEFSGVPHAGSGTPGSSVCQSHFRSASGLQGRLAIVRGSIVLAC